MCVESDLTILRSMPDSEASERPGPGVPGGIERIGVVGCGLMGSGVAEVSARAGLAVVVVEAEDELAKAGRFRIEASLSRGLKSGKISQEDLDGALAKIDVTSDYDTLGACDLIVEAVTESEPAKEEVFRILDRVVENPEAILASNTSSIPIMKLGMVTARPERVVGLHFFNPVPVLKLVELVPSLLTGEDTVSRVEAFATERLGKRVIHCQDRAGFVVNALLIPYILSAVRMMESGFASAGDIDTGMVEGCAHPMGPLALADLIGLDTTAAVAQSLYEEFKEPLYAPPPLLLRMVEAGLMGRKAGRGFFEYARL